MTDEEKRRVLEMHDAGMGYKAISRETGISASTIASFCKKTERGSEDSCLQCGVKLVQTPNRKKKKFCSDRCRALWWNAHLDRVNRQAYYTAVCQQCGKEFISYGNDHRKYCSRECYTEHRRGAAPISRGSEKEPSPEVPRR